MPVDIPAILINSAAAFGIGVLLYEFKIWTSKTFIDLDSEEDVSSTDSSFVYSVEEEEGKKKSDDKPRLVIRTLKVKKKN